ncbi:hypothetical protein LTR28_004260, partial [Elasticomyces elasticus]
PFDTSTILGPLNHTSTSTPTPHPHPHPHPIFHPRLPNRPTMQRNIVVFVIIIVLFVLLALIGFGIYWAQNGFSRGRGVRSESSSEG